MADPLSIAVLGAGNLGLAQAGHLASLGHRVRLYNRTKERLTSLAAGPLRVSGAVTAEAKLECVTDDLAAAVRGAQIIFVDVPASAHAEIGRALNEALSPAPNDEPQVLMLHPGQTFGARQLARELDLGRFPQLTIGELQTALYTCRAPVAGAAPGDPAAVTVFAIKRRVAMAAYPAAAAERLRPIGDLYPQVFEAPSTLHTALSNVQSFIHPAVCLLNATRIEGPSPFLIYREGLTPAVGTLMEACDRERLAVAQALGVEVPTVAEWFALCYGVRASTALQAMREVRAYDEMLGPTSLDSRLITEDVPTGLVPLSELAVAMGVEAPALTGLLRAIRVVAPRRQLGRTLHSLGLAGMGPRELTMAF